LLPSVATSFKPDDPTIKSCFDGRLDGFLHFMKAVADEQFPGMDNSNILPGEEYRHPINL